MLKSRRIILPIALILLAFCALYTLYLTVWSAPPDQARATALLSETLAAESYRYTIDAAVFVDGASRSYFSLQGEKNATAAALSGTVLGTDLQLVLLPGTFYQKSGSADWQSLAVADVASALELFAELDPAAAFAFTEISSYSYDGLVEQADGKKALAFTLAVQPSGWVADFFSDVRILMTTDRRGKEIKSLQLNAVSRENPSTTLQITARFFDQGQTIDIQAPQLPSTP